MRDTSHYVSSGVDPGFSEGRVRIRGGFREERRTVSMKQGGLGAQPMGYLKIKVFKAKFIRFLNLNGVN